MARGGGISHRWFVQVLQNALSFIGVASGKYNTHSFRIGAALHWASKGASNAQIRLWGCLKSAASKHTCALSTMNDFKSAMWVYSSPFPGWWTSGCGVSYLCNTCSFSMGQPCDKTSVPCSNIFVIISHISDIIMPTPPNVGLGGIGPVFLNIQHLFSAWWTQYYL